MNNAAGPEQLIESLGENRVLTGFPGAAGYREGYKIVFMNGRAGATDGGSAGEPNWRRNREGEAYCC